MLSRRKRRRLLHAESTYLLSNGAASSTTTTAGTTTSVAAIGSGGEEVDAVGVSAGNSDEDEQWDLSGIDDTLSTIELFKSRNATGFAQMGLPPVVLQHQLYSILSNPTFADQNLTRLRGAKKLLLFRVALGKSDRGVILYDDYLQQVQQQTDQLVQQEEKHQLEQLEWHGKSCLDDSIPKKRQALARFQVVFPNISTQTVLTLQYLMEQLADIASKSQFPTAIQRKWLELHQLDDRTIQEDIIWLQRLGFLVSSVELQNESFYLSIPGIGKLISSIHTMRKRIPRILSSCTYKQMLQHQLQKLPLIRKSARFDIEFYLADLEGIGVVSRQRVPSGTLVTLLSS